MDVTIIDAGIGNVRSVLRMFEEVDADAEIVSEPAAACTAKRLVLPGVGAFDAGMGGLDRRDWRLTLNELGLDRRIPVLGICLGMHLLFERSDEGSAAGLGWITGEVRKIDTGGDPRLKLPHMGWAEVTPVRDNPLLVAGHDVLPRFYHVHNYAAACTDPTDVIGTAIYGATFVSAVQRGNIFGVQFHPEKSHRFGMELLRRFAALPC